jgi:hypothetical protein
VPPGPTRASAVGGDATIALGRAGGFEPSFGAVCSAAFVACLGDGGVSVAAKLGELLLVAGADVGGALLTMCPDLVDVGAGGVSLGCGGGELVPGLGQGVSELSVGSGRGRQLQACS